MWKNNSHISQAMCLSKSGSCNVAPLVPGFLVLLLNLGEFDFTVLCQKRFDFAYWGFLILLIGSEFASIFFAGGGILISSQRVCVESLIWGKLGFLRNQCSFELIFGICKGERR
ncbi:hypothetical protein QVD17_01841 [Tagetes erecta]|uniref:Uncharacterized protein n=1 Tax=Tagetes erecta TaxID=13708 RepID=A0AAD8P8L8_TARER|nr:hypothetical protein QVD17_01841 [Tagetes erecta]